MTSEAEIVCDELVCQQRHIEFSCASHCRGRPP